MVFSDLRSRLLVRG